MAWLEKLKSNLWLRILLVLVSLLFIAGAAVNDGLTRMFWGLPIIILLFFALPLNKIWKTIISLVALGATIYISLNIYTSPLVYPVIDQKVTILEDLPLKDDDGQLRYDYYLERDGTARTNISSVNHVPAGSVYYVKKIIMCGEMYGHHCYLLSNGDKEIAITYTSINDWSEKRISSNFCSKADWKYCEKIEMSSGASIDPMRKSFRIMSNLMLYPVTPMLIFDGLVNGACYIIPCESMGL